MADFIVDSNTFEYTYSAKQQEEINQIRNKYLPRQESKMEQLIKLDKKAEQPGAIVSITVGIIGTLILGFGMCCTTVWNDKMSTFVIGILVGILGMIIAGMAYPLYQKITKAEREKIADQVLALTSELSLEI